MTNSEYWEGRLLEVCARAFGCKTLGGQIVFDDEIDCSTALLEEIALCADELRSARIKADVEGCHGC